MAFALLGTGQAGATPSSSGVDRQTYVADTHPVNPYAAQPDRPRVAVAAGRQVAHGLVHLAAAGGVANGRLTLTAMSEAASPSAQVKLEACPVTAAWDAPLDRSAPPPHDCEAVAAPFAAEEGGVWTLDLSQLAPYWAQRPNHGVALVASEVAPDQSWQVEFDPERSTFAPADAAEPTGAGSAPQQGATVPAPADADAPSTGFPRLDQAPVSMSEATPSFPDVAAGPAEAAPAPSLAPEAASSVLAARTPPASRGDRPLWPWLLWLVALLAVLGARSERGSRALDQARRAVAARVAPLVPRRIPGVPKNVATGVAAALAVGAGLLALRAFLPAGLPLGVLALGVLLGSLTALTALGLVLVFRVVRAINMAQTEIGAVAASAAVILVVGQSWSYLVAVPAGLVLAAVTGLGVEATMHRFRTSPRLILTVATIGVAQVLAAVNVLAPQLVSDLRPSHVFTTPFRVSFSIDPITFTGDAVVAVIVVPLVLLALTALLARTNTGRAMRAVADSTERAELVGIPIRRVLRTTWVVAAVLSGIAAILTAPVVGPALGVAAGPEALLAPLAAATVGRMESLPRTAVAAVAIGVVQQAFFWSFPRSSTVDVVLFVVILLSLFLTRTASSRVSDSGLGQYSAVSEPRPIPGAVRALPSVRATRVVMALAVAFVAVAAPVLFGESDLIIVTYIAIVGVVAVSLVVLTGWAGQVTLGQFALAGVGGAVTAFALSRHNLDLFLALGLAAVAASLCAVLVGMSTVRLSGQFAAVATLAFAVPASTFLLSPSRFPDLNPMSIERPELLGRYPLDDSTTFYYLCLGVLVTCFLGARNLRRCRVGRALIAVRDNERAAAGWSIAAARTKLIAFAVSGAIAGIGGGLYVTGLRGMPQQGFSPLASLEVFTMVVVGGLGSLSGAILGAVYVGAVQSLLGGAAQLFATGAGLLVLLLLLPEGIGGLLFRARDAWYRRLAGRAGITLFPTAAGSEDSAAAPVPLPDDAPPGALLVWRDVTAAYGKLQVLFDVSGHVDDGESLALLGTNGAGKSTLLRVLGGVLPARRGQVVYAGEDITRLSPQERLRKGIVTVPGGRGVFPSLTVEENLRLFAWTLPDQRTTSSAIDEVWALFPRLQERSGEKASQLSGGEQQMLALSQAIICKPRLLLIDELTLGLAPGTVRILLGVLETLRARGVTTILVEQSLTTAASIAPRCNFMERGSNRYDGSIQDLMDRDDLARAVFLTPGVPATVVSEEDRGSAEPALVLSARDVRKRFGGVVALDGMSVDVPRGSIVGLIGPNGAGKTSLLDACFGFLLPDSGTITYLDRDITRLPAHARADLGLGRIFQDARLIPSMTVREILATALERHVEVREPVACILRLGACVDSERAVEARVDELLDAFGLTAYAESFARDLSTGSRRVVEIACAVAHSPSVLLLDEPTAGVAQRETEALAARLLAARRELGLTMLIVEHDLGFISTLADQLVCMDLGRELSSGAPDDVLQDPRVLEAYFGIAAQPGAPREDARPDTFVASTQELS